MQLLNKSKRYIDGYKPDELFEVSEEHGKRLLSLYGENQEIVKIEVQQAKKSHKP